MDSVKKLLMVCFVSFLLDRGSTSYLYKVLRRNGQNKLALGHQPHNDHPTTEGCWCPSRNTPSVKVCETLDPKGHGLQRLLVYIYMDSATNEVIAYVPGLEKQKSIPELYYEPGDTLIRHFKQTILDLFKSNINVIKLHGDKNDYPKSDSSKQKTDELSKLVIGSKTKDDSDKNIDTSEESNEILDNDSTLGKQLSISKENDATVKKSYNEDKNTDEPIGSNLGTIETSYSKDNKQGFPITFGNLTPVYNQSGNLKLPINSHIFGIQPNKEDEGNDYTDTQYGGVDYYPGNIDLSSSDVYSPKEADTDAITSVLKNEQSKIKPNEVTNEDLTRSVFTPAPPHKHEEKNHEKYVEDSSDEYFEDNVPYLNTAFHGDNGNLYITFDKWFQDQMKRLQKSQPINANSIDMKKLKNHVEKIFRANGIYRSSDGVLINGKGEVLDTNNLKIRPVLIGDSVGYEYLKASGDHSLPSDLPYLSSIVITAISPLKVLGVISLGKSYLLKSNNSYDPAPANIKGKLHSSVPRPLAHLEKLYKKKPIQHPIKYSDELQKKSRRKEDESLKENALNLADAILSSDKSTLLKKQVPGLDTLLNSVSKLVNTLGKVSNTAILGGGDDDQQFRIVGGDHALYSGVILKNKGRSGLIEELEK